MTIGLTIIPFGLFTTPLVEEFGASISQIQLGLALFVVMMAAAGTIVGRLLDRASIRSIMAAGSSVMALSLLAMSFATELWQLGALFAIGASSGVSMAGPLAGTTVIAKWFDLKRGRAVGIATMGPPAGGLVLMPLAGWLLESFGWRGTPRAFALLAATVAPIVLAVVRNSPDEVGQEIDGGHRDTGAAAPDNAIVWTPAQILQSRNFWALAFAIGIVFGLGAGWNANLPRFGEDLGHTGQEMSVLLGIGAGLGVPATLLFGFLADHVDNRRLLWLCVGGQMLGLAALSMEPTGALFVAAVLLPGFAGGGLLPVHASIVGRLFGAESFGTVVGFGGLVMLPFGAAAPVLAGAVRDATGSYVGALQIFAAAFAVSCALLVLVRR